MTPPLLKYQCSRLNECKNAAINTALNHYYIDYSLTICSFDHSFIASGGGF